MGRSVYKVVISVCLFVCFNSGTPGQICLKNLIGVLGRPTGMLLAWFWDSELSGSTSIAKMFRGKIAQERVNGRSNFKQPGQRWVSKLVLNKNK